MYYTMYRTCPWLLLDAKQAPSSGETSPEKKARRKTQHAVLRTRADAWAAGEVSGLEMFGGTAEVWWIVKVEGITVKLDQWVGAEKSTVDYGGAFCLRYGVLYCIVQVPFSVCTSNRAANRRVGHGGDTGTGTNLCSGCTWKLGVCVCVL